MAESNPTGPAPDPLAELVEEFMRLRRRGEHVAVPSFAARAGERAAELRDLLESVEALEQARSAADAVAVDERPPQRLGDFRIVREIGRGGMGVVYEAEHVALDRRVALKVLPAHAMRGSRIERFQREARTAARLHHTNIVPIFGVGEHDGVHFYVMQLIHGCGLDRVLAALRGEPAEDNAATATEALLQGTIAGSVAASAARTGIERSVAAIGAQVAGALEYAHGLGTLHRDIKPANLLIDADGQVWVTDFGLAKATEDADMTLSGQFVGTLQYMAPEQLQGSGDARTDVYCLGLTLYEVLTLRPPYGTGTRSELLQRIGKASIEPPRRAALGVSRDLETILLKALAGEPRDRYQDAAALAADLRAFLDDRPIAARRATAAELAWRWCRRNRTVAALAALALLGLTAAVVAAMIGSVRTARALARAEANMTLALAAFEDVFAGIIGPDLIVLGSEDDEDRPSIGMVRAASHRDAAVLQSLLQFYDRFTEENQDNTRLREQTARAHQRVGEIQLQLGNAADAEIALRRALALCGENRPAAAQRALLHNEIGRCRIAAHDFDAARAAFERTLAIDAGDQRAVRFEQARAHDYLALTEGGRAWYQPRPPGAPPRRRGPNWQANALLHHRAAEALVAELLQQEPDNKTLLLARAGTLRFLSLLEGRDGARARRREALTILERLVADEPRSPHLRAELAAALTDGPPERDGPQAGSGSLQRAAELTESLLDEFPTVQAYNELALEVLPRLAGAQESADPAASARAWKTALDCLRRLAPGEHREATERWLQQGLASALVCGQRLDEARRLLEEMAVWVDRTEPPAVRAEGSSRPARPGGRERDRPPPPRNRTPGLSLAELYEAVGDHARATRLRGAPK